jgi:hypothetical protein
MAASANPGAGTWNAKLSQMNPAVIDQHLRAIKARPDWPAKIHVALSSDDRLLFSTAAEAAKVFGIDTWDIYFERLQRGEDQFRQHHCQTDHGEIIRIVDGGRYHAQCDLRLGFCGPLRSNRAPFACLPDLRDRRPSQLR